MANITSREYTVIGKLIETGKYVHIIHEGGYSLLKAIDLAKTHDNELYSDKRVVRVETSRVILDALNGNSPTTADSIDKLHEQMESQITHAIRTFMALFPVDRPRIKEVFVGHEGYEVQVTLEAP